LGFQARPGYQRGPRNRFRLICTADLTLASIKVYEKCSSTLSQTANSNVFTSIGGPNRQKEIDMKGFILTGVLALSLTSALAKDGNGAFEARLENRIAARSERAQLQPPKSQNEDTATSADDCGMPKCC
jgi:hypothetical protein